VLNNALVTATIAGPRTEAQWDGYATVLDYKFTAADAALIDRLVPPGHPFRSELSDALSVICPSMEVRYDLPDFRRRMLAAERRSGNQIFAHRQSADDDGVETNLSDEIERRYPIFAAGDRLAVDDAGPGAQLGDRLDDERESVGQVIARPAIELHPFAVLSGDDPKPVVLDFMQPSLARRRLRTFDGEARRNEPSRQDTRT
jgi:hypothetical protein